MYVQAHDIALGSTVGSAVSKDVILLMIVDLFNVNNYIYYI